jgi:hypothetical protein
MNNTSKEMMKLLDDNKDKKEIDSDFYLKMSNLLLEHSKVSESKKYEITYIKTFFRDNIEQNDADDEYILYHDVFKKTVFGGSFFSKDDISPGGGIEFENIDGCEYITNDDDLSMQEIYKTGEYENGSTIFYRKYTLVDIKEIKDI